MTSGAKNEGKKKKSEMKQKQKKRADNCSYIMTFQTCVERSRNVARCCPIAKDRNRDILVQVAILRVEALKGERA